MNQTLPNQSISTIQSRPWLYECLRWCLLIFIMGVGSALNAQNYIFNDSFESDVLGAKPEGWIMKYNGTGTANQKVVDTPVMYGTHAFQMEGRSSWASEFYKVPSEMPDEVTLEAWINAEKSLSGLTGSIGLGNFTVGTWGTRTSRLQFFGGKISATYYSGSQGPVYIIQDYVPGTWYHVKMAHNLTARTYKVFIDGVQVSGTDGSTTVSEFPMAQTVESIHVMLAAGNSGTTKMFFDDIRLYETSHLVAHYPFDGNAEDASGQQHHGTAYGASLTADKDGNANSAYYFDGVDDYIDLGDWENGGPMTITFWARWNAFNNYSRIIDLGNGASADNIIVSNYQMTNKLFFQIYGTTTKAIPSYYNILTPNTWDFYTAKVDENGLMRIYKNGVFQTEHQQGVTPNVVTRTRQYIARSNFPQDGYFKGAIDDVRIYNAALDDSEIQNLYSVSTAITPVEEETNISVYPNPVSDKLIVNLIVAAQYHLEVYTINGKKIYDSYGNGKHAEIDCSEFAQGIYMVAITSGEKNRIVKVVKD